MGYYDLVMLQIVKHVLVVLQMVNYHLVISQMTKYRHKLCCYRLGANIRMSYIIGYFIDRKCFSVH